MKLLFVARAIDNMAGGVERMISRVMNAMAARGHEVALFTWDQAGARSFYELDPKITWHRLDMGDPGQAAGRALKLRRAQKIRALVKQQRPDCIVCFQDGPFMAMRAYTMGLGVPVVAAERNAPTRFDHTSAARRKNLTFHAFRFAHSVLVQCESYRERYPAFLRNRIVTIPNPVFPAEMKADPVVPTTSGRFTLLSVGRLGYQKNYEVLVRAFTSLATRFPLWDLVIVGEGEEREKLEGLVSSLELQERIMLPGTSRQMADHYASAHLFCLPSRWEGFPNALGEALAHGLPSVGFADCAGVNELIRDGENGWLAEGNGDPVSLSSVLVKAMDNAQVRREMGEAAVASVQCYEPKEIYALWEKTLSEAAGR